MKQIVFDAPYSAAVIETPDNPTGDHEVRVRMKYTAVSAGTEHANLIGSPNVSGTRNSGVRPFPRMLGYSGSGIVEEVGNCVRGVKPGDRVITRWGQHKEVNTLPVENTVVISDDSTSLLDASFLFISTFGLAAVRKVRIELGESCLVVGLGLLGIFSVQYAHLNGAMPVIAVDLNRERRELALRLGADIALDPTDPDYVEKIMKATGGQGAETVIEVTGNGKALNQALLGTAPMGRIALLGCSREESLIDLYHDVHYPGIQLIGAHTFARPKHESYPGYWTEQDDCRTALRYLSAGRLRVRDMISEVHKIEDATEVYERLVHDPDFPLGVAFSW